MNIAQLRLIVTLLVAVVLSSCSDGGSDTIRDDLPTIDADVGGVDYAGFIDVNYPSDWTVDVFPEGTSVVDMTLPFDTANLDAPQFLTVGVSPNNQIICAGQRLVRSSPFATMEGFLAQIITQSESAGERIMSVSDTQTDGREAREVAFETVLSNGVGISGLAIVFSLEASETTIERHVDFLFECISTTTSFTTKEPLVRQILSSITIR